MSDLRKDIIELLDKHLPVPDLPEEHPCDLCDGKGELLTICERCHGAGGLTKPELKVGDYLRFDNGLVQQFHKNMALNPEAPNGYGTWIKLPGRPLTTDDLMLVLSGEKITVECHACGCDKGGGITGDLYAETDDPEDDELDGSMLYFHHTNNPKGAGNYQLASFKDGYIVFADGVEGNIYIVGEA